MLDTEFIEHRKIRLIKMITQLNDAAVLDTIEDLLIHSKKDWWQTISDAEKKAIDIGLEDIKNGRTKSHEQVMQETDKRYKGL